MQYYHDYFSFVQKVLGNKSKIVDKCLNSPGIELLQVCAKHDDLVNIHFIVLYKHSDVHNTLYMYIADILFLVHVLIC